MKKLFLLCGLGATLCLTGCFQSDTLITVKPDGSGTVTATTLLGKMVMKQMQEQGSDESAKAFADMEKKMRAAVKKMGEGVTCVSTKKVKTGDGEGYTASYAFTDINMLKINQNLGDGSSTSTADNSSSPTDRIGVEVIVTDDSKPEYITFELKKGSVNELIIHSPVAAPAAKTKAKTTPPGAEEMQLKMMGEMYKDMKINIAVQVAGKIDKTDATYVDGSKVTLLALDFNKLIANPAKFKALAATESMSLAESKKLIADVPGMKAELLDNISIRFK